MIVIGKTILSDEIRDTFFVCNLEKCKGACCVEGDMGAPLERDELEILNESYHYIKPYLSEKGIKAIEENGTYVVDEEGEFSTPVTKSKECAYAVYDERGILKCGIEQAHKDGKISFKKPVSCHLYPIRISKYDDFEAINYHKWQICSAACSFGEELKIPLYKFLKEPLIRKYGEGWYLQLVDMIEKGESQEEVTFEV
jgi:hypothetical protein